MRTTVRPSRRPENARARTQADAIATSLPREREGPVSATLKAGHVGGFFRKGAVTSDVRPPPPPTSRSSVGLCERCGEYVLTGEGLDGAGVLRHFVCDAIIRGAVARKVEAVRSIHRAIGALSRLPDVQRALMADLAAMPDVIELGDAIAVLDRARLQVECTAFDQPEQRRLALSYLDTMLRKLRA
jgi:hypothetical protein